MPLQNLSIGHYSNLNEATGVSVFLFHKSVPCGYWLCGSAPATRDIAVLNLDNCVEKIDALVFSGGSAGGLGAANGVMDWLREKGRGLPTMAGPVPIVPAAAIFDWNVVSPAIPTPQNAYEACSRATEDLQQSGRIGAGTGSSVGKLFSDKKYMPGGFGSALLKTQAGLEVFAAAVVNCVGDVWNGDKIIAGAKSADNTFFNTAEKLRGGYTYQTPIAQNTTLVFVGTNAALTNAQLMRISKMATAGMARAIQPCFTLFDGDILFAASLGDVKADELMVGELAAEAVRQAIIKAVQ